MRIMFWIIPLVLFVFGCSDDAEPTPNQGLRDLTSGRGLTLTATPTIEEISRNIAIALVSLRLTNHTDPACRAKANSRMAASVEPASQQWIVSEIRGTSLPNGTVVQFKWRVDVGARRVVALVACD